MAHCPEVRGLRGLVEQLGSFPKVAVHARGEAEDLPEAIQCLCLAAIEKTRVSTTLLNEWRSNRTFSQEVELPASRFYTFRRTLDLGKCVKFVAEGYM
jgi:hypothetical protein